MSTEWDSLVGNEAVKGYLDCLLRSQRFGHSLLFSGPRGVGKSLFAYAFATEVMCLDDGDGRQRMKMRSRNHPDVYVYMPEGKTGMHSIASMRQFSQEVYMAPFEGRKKIFIIQDAERMLPTSANALLKTFEEPSAASMIFLVSSQTHRLLPTIVSRCLRLRFHPVIEQDLLDFLKEEKKVEATRARQVVMRANGSLAKALALLEDEEDKKEKDLLDALALGKLQSFVELQELIQSLDAKVEEVKKNVEVTFRQEIRHDLEDLSAYAREVLEKEVEGAVSMRAMAEAQTLFELILSWYRDLNLVYSGGNPHYLMHRDRKDDFLSSLSRYAPPALDQVQKAIEEARLALQRSIKLSTCLENLFLKINFV